MYCSTVAVRSRDGARVSRVASGTALRMSSSTSRTRRVSRSRARSARSRSSRASLRASLGEPLGVLAAARRRAGEAEQGEQERDEEPRRHDDGSTRACEAAYERRARAARRPREPSARRSACRRAITSNSSSAWPAPSATQVSADSAT